MTRPTSLPQRNLLRHLTWGLPSGQAIAEAMGAPVLSRADLTELAGLRPRLDTTTPLWYYILKEAEVRQGACTSGPSAGGSSPRCSSACCRPIRDAYLNVQPDFPPTLPTGPATRPTSGWSTSSPSPVWTPPAEASRGKPAINLSTPQCGLKQTVLDRRKSPETRSVS